MLVFGGCQMNLVTLTGSEDLCGSIPAVEDPVSEDQEQTEERDI